MDKEEVVHIYNGMLAISSKMDEPRSYHTKWSKSDRERQLNEFIHRTDTD